MLKKFYGLMVALSILAAPSQLIFANQAHGKHQNHDAFTKKNIEAYPKKKYYFIELAKKNITAYDYNTLDAFHTLLIKYPKTAVILTPFIFKESAKVNVTLIRDCIGTLLTHQATLDSKKSYIEQYASHIISTQKYLSMLIRQQHYNFNFNGDSYAQIVIQWAKDVAIKNIDSLSVTTINAIYNFMEGTHFATLIHNRFGAVSQDEITNSLLMRWIDHTLYYVTYDTSLAKPLFLYKKFLENLTDEQKISLVLERLAQFSVTDLEHIYSHFIKQPQDRERLKEAARQLFGASKIDMPTLLINGIPEKLEKPKFIYENARLNFVGTQTEHHFYANLAAIVTLFKYQPERNSTPAVKKMLWDAFVQETEEKRKGRYVFWHGRNWQWHFRADIYKSLYNLTASAENKMRDNYIPLRFGDNPETRYQNSLFLNYALFGNASNHGSGTVAFVLGNYDVSRYITSYTVDWFFSKFGLDRYYTKYQDKLTQLEELHGKANSGNYGNLLLISVAEKDLNRIQPAHEYPGLIDIEIGNEKTHDMKKIIDALQNNPMAIQKGQSDIIEFTMKLDDTYALDPKKGLHIYSFDACDETVMKEYVALRDEIFANIARDIKAGTY